MSLPGAVDAKRIGSDALEDPVTWVVRMTTGSANYVFEVATASGRRAVVRFMRSAAEHEAAIYWSRTLGELRLPLPRLLSHGSGRPRNAEPDAPWGWLVLERFPGKDLEHVYAALSAAQKLAILERVMHAQALVQSMPEGPGYGWMVMPNEWPHITWYRVIAQGLERSRQRIKQVGAVSAAAVVAMERLIPQFDDYFSTIRPIPFLDDTTTKNVIVSDEGVFQGIVDVDGICYGDPLLVVALTRMALLKLGGDTLYTDAWLDRLSATPEQRRAVDFYTAYFCVDFLSETGQRFNRDVAPPIDFDMIDRLIAILNRLLPRIA